jgi:UDP-glucose 4-epimerase
MKDSRVLITGASGFLGSHLSARLASEDVSVHAVSRTSRNDPATIIGAQTTRATLRSRVSFVMTYSQRSSFTFPVYPPLAPATHHLAGKESGTFNLGNSQGFSVRQVVDVAIRITGSRIEMTVGPRRAGDAPVLVGNSQKARALLGWTTESSELEVIVETAWRWHQRLVRNRLALQVNPAVDT